MKRKRHQVRSSEYLLTSGNVKVVRNISLTVDVLMEATNFLNTR